MNINILKKSGAKIILAVLAVFILVGVTMTTTVHGLAFYETDEFNVEINVGEDGVYWVTEEIKINPLSDGHGIYRYIPMSGTAYMQRDGQVLEIRRDMEVKDVKVDGYLYETYKENGNMVVKIGSGDYYVEGPQTYTINYKCVLHEDGISDYDFLYYNVIPQGWETSIKNVNIIVNMPKDFDKEKLWFYAGAYGYADENRVTYTVDGNAVTANVPGGLLDSEGVTLQMELPEGYFVGEKNNDWAIPMIYVGCIIAAVLAMLLWFFFGRDAKVVKTVEFYPPENMTPADVGYIVDGMVDKEDIVSMIIYFADKGYIEISEEKKKKRSAYYLIKKEELPENEKTFAATLFDGLFQKGDKVAIEDLGEDFYAYYAASKSELKGYYTENAQNRIFTTSSKIARGFGYVLAGLPIGILIALSAIANYDSEVSIAAFVLMAILIGGYMIIISAFDRRYNLKKSKYMGLVAGGSFIAAVPILISFGLCGFVYGNILASIIAIIASLVAFGFTGLMYKRTKKSAEDLGKILGFKEFIRVAEVDRLKKMVEEDPKYFYGVLPYAYIFGLSDKWAKKFEEIAVEPPVWYNGYYGNDMFSTWMFINMFNSCTRSIGDNIAIPPAEEGGNDGGIGNGGFGSFGGGGGFSGGGFGGGGGGGW